MVDLAPEKVPLIPEPAKLPSKRAASNTIGLAGRPRRAASRDKANRSPEMRAPATLRRMGDEPSRPARVVAPSRALALTGPEPRLDRIAPPSGQTGSRVRPSWI